MEGASNPLKQVIEDIGFGKAQMIQLLLSGVVLFGNGGQTGLTAIVTTSVAKDFNLNTLEQSLLTSFLFAGMGIGSIVSGRIGDRWGRWYPIVMSNVVQTIMSTVAAASPNWIALGVCRIFSGCAMGLGLPPMCAMLSEISPEKWKIPVRAMNDAFFDFGYIYAAFLATMDDPNLQGLHWRLLMVLNSLPIGLIGLFTFFYLKESPVFLANIGEDAKAKQVLQSMWSANKGTSSQSAIEYQVVRRAEHEKSTSIMAELRLVLSKYYIFTTATLCCTCYCGNLYFYGGMYAQPQVMASSSETWLAGTQMVVGGFFDLLGLAAAAIVASMISRKTTLIATLLATAVCAWCFGFAGSVSGRSVAMEAYYQFGVFGFYWVPSLLFVVLYQFVVESYPSSVASTGAGLCQAIGRLGAIFAPQVYEYITLWTGHWEYFCYFVAAASCLAAVSVLRMNPTRDEAWPLIAEKSHKHKDKIPDKVKPDHASHP